MDKDMSETLVRTGPDTNVDVPVQRGRQLPRPDMPDALEILSGLQKTDKIKGKQLEDKKEEPKPKV